MDSKIFSRLAFGVFMATLGIGSAFGCSSAMSPQSTSTISTIDEIQQQVNIVVGKFLDLNNKNALNSPKAKGLFSGELTGWDTPTIGEIKGEADSIIFLDPSNAVVRIQIESGYVFDVYLYLSHDSDWKITAIRAMALPGFVRQTYVELSNKAELSSEEQSTLDEIKRMFLTDAEWRNYFLQNQSLFEALCAKAIQVPELSFVNRDNMSTFPTIQEEFVSLSVSTLEEQDGNIQIVMDGMIDNTVGFTCSPNDNPPKISASQYIWVEEIIEGWYLFRTT